LSGIIRSDEKELPDDLAFWCFDLLDSTDSVLIDRIKQYEVVNDTYFHAVPQRLVTCANDVHVMFEDALADGFEGLILRSPMSKYKFGRATVKENIAFKVKPYLTFDSVIVAVTQATVAREGSEKKINELGRSVTSQKKDDRVLIDKAATFIVLHEGKECGISLAMTDEEKIEIWKNKNNYIGRTIEYKGLVIGSKDVPRHCVFVRYRDDK
jgi:DNA ligase-1